MIKSTTMPRNSPREAGQNSRASILYCLSEDGPLSIRELAVRLPIARSTIHQHVALLRTAGYVRVHYGQTGRVELTEAGRMALGK